MFVGWIFSQIWLAVRPLIKWLLRQATRLCELQRICYGTEAGFRRAEAVERSLRLSRTSKVQEVIADLDEAADTSMLCAAGDGAGPVETAIRAILIAKRVNPTVHRPFVESLGRCLELIWGYRQLQAELEELRLTVYDASNEEHEAKLLTLWKTLCPNEPLISRVTKQWQYIGFQGDDPKTDFRGMGLLGLENLLYFAKEFPPAARHVLGHSQHPAHGYAFAVVGINITALALGLVRDGAARTHIWNTAPLGAGIPTIRAFHRLYAYLYYEFDKFWIASRPKDVMEFPEIRNRFEDKLRRALSEPSAAFIIDFVIDTV